MSHPVNESAEDSVTSGSGPDASPHRVVYAYNGFYQGRKELGPTSSWELTWRESLRSRFGASLVTFNPDAFGPTSNRESDAALLDLVREFDPDMLVMISHVGIEWERDFISRETLRSIRAAGVKVVAIWGDLQFPKERKQLRALRGCVDLNACTASQAVAQRMSHRDPMMYTWVPISDEPLAERCDCGALVSYAGALKQGRDHTIAYLEAQGIRVHVGGGEGAKALTREEYLRLLAHPIAISFSRSDMETVTNARTFEVIRQGVVLMEQWGRETAKLLAPYVEYVPWNDHQDLLQQITRLATDPERRARIADNGRLASERFSNDALWARVLDRIGEHSHALPVESFAVDWAAYRGPHRRREQMQDWLSRRPEMNGWLTFRLHLRGATYRTRRLLSSARRVSAARHADDGMLHDEETSS